MYLVDDDYDDFSCLFSFNFLHAHTRGFAIDRKEREVGIQTSVFGAPFCLVADECASMQPLIKAKVDVISK